MLPSDSQVPTEGWPAFKARLTGLGRMLFSSVSAMTGGDAADAAWGDYTISPSPGRATREHPASHPRFKRDSAYLASSTVTNQRHFSQGVELLRLPPRSLFRVGIRSLVPQGPQVVNDFASIADPEGSRLISATSTSLTSSLRKAAVRRGRVSLMREESILASAPWAARRTYSTASFCDIFSRVDSTSLVVKPMEPRTRQVMARLSASESSRIISKPGMAVLDWRPNFPKALLAARKTSISLSPKRATRAWITSASTTPIFPNAPAAAARTFASDSLRAAINAGIACFPLVPNSPSVLAADSRTEASPSLTRPSTRAGFVSSRPRISPGLPRPRDGGPHPCRGRTSSKIGTTSLVS